MALPGSSNNKGVALRKRQQIDSSKRTMFIAVAVAAFAVGAALVIAYFLANQIWFHTKIIAAKQDTLSTIKKNIEAVDELKDNIRVLDTNETLNSSKRDKESSALQVILDALPSKANSDALGASLQLRFAGEVGGVVVEALSVDVVDEDDTSGESSSSSDESDSPSIGFRMTVAGSAKGLKELLARFEKSIRVIKLDSIEIQAGENRLTMVLTGRSFYEPARVIEVGTRVEKP